MSCELPLWSGPSPGALGDGAEDRPRLAPFLLDGCRAPCVVVCPGGGYHRRAAHEGDPVARWLNGLGYHACVLHYRTHPYRHPVPHGDAARALRLVRHRAAEWGVDGRVGILGFSAGGHLAASLATINDDGDALAADPVERQPSRPDAAILCYPVIDLGAHRHQGSRDNLIGPDPDPALVEALSPQRRVSQRTPPCFLWHTADDPVVPVENALLFAQACRTQRVPVALHVFPEGRHGLGLAEQHPAAWQWTSLCATWLAQLWGDPGSRSPEVRESGSRVHPA